jgi:hypothetical protein
MSPTGAGNSPGADVRCRRSPSSCQTARQRPGSSRGGDAVLQLDDLAAAPGGGAPGPAHEDLAGRASGRLPLCAAGSRATAWLWGS